MAAEPQIDIKKNILNVIHATAIFPSIQNVCRLPGSKFGLEQQFLL
jgi:hypothetical protein